MEDILIHEIIEGHKDHIDERKNKNFDKSCNYLLIQILKQCFKFLMNYFFLRIYKNGCYNK